MGQSINQSIDRSLQGERYLSSARVGGGGGVSRVERERERERNRALLIRYRSLSLSVCLSVCASMTGESIIAVCADVARHIDADRRLHVDEQ